MTPMKKIVPSPAHQRVRDKMLAVIRTEAATMDASEILAIAAYTVGQLIALQDQRKMTPQMALAIVSENIEAGNFQAQKDVLSADKGNPQ